MASPEDDFISGIYEVLPGAPPLGAGGQIAFAVRDHRQGRRDLMAVQVSRELPARAVALSTLAGQQIDGMILPVTHGAGRMQGGREGYFVVQPMATGRALIDPILPMPPLGERALIDQVLRPAALALDRLTQLGLTHRAIRPDNVFLARDGAAVRSRAGDDALDAARQLELQGLAAVFVDTSARPRSEGADLANAMSARYVSLPYVEAGAVRDVVIAATPGLERAPPRSR